MEKNRIILKDYEYYQDDWSTIYLGDCRDILPLLEPVDLVLTDPPYPDQHLEYGLIDIGFLNNFDCRRIIFWTAKIDFPLPFDSIHIWDKLTGCGSQYERIFDKGGDQNWRVFRYYLINSTVAASYTGDIFTGHPSQKPVKLLQDLIGLSKTSIIILDPFMGSGTTLVAAKNLNRKAIGIEIEEKYCEIAANRLAKIYKPDDKKFILGEKKKNIGLIF